MSKVNLIPELRFHEFKNEEEWDLKEFSKYIKLDRGSSPRPIQDYLTQDNSGVNWIKIGDTKNAINSVIYSVEEKITLKGAEKSRRVEKGELILANSMSFGKTYELAIEGCIYDGWFVLRKFESHFNKSFLLQMLNSDFMQNQYKRLSAGGIVQNISSDIVYNSKLFYTQLLEQKKIASCLSSLDEIIAAHSQKLDALKDHKKGLMQNLFPQEGETVPKYRFREFEKDGEWVKTKLGDSAIFINGRAYKQEELLETGKYRVLRVGNFFTNKNWYYSDLELEEDKYCKDGDLLYAWSASFGPRVWKGEKVIYHYHIWKVLPAESISNDFLFVLLDKETERMKTQNANGFALLHITKGTIESWECSIPKSKVEQQKIASCLSSLDALISAEAEKIEQLKLHKKGLMQGLFPQITN